MEKYFDKFKTITYANTVVRDITQRAAFLTTVYNDPMFYYPYDVAQGERPDMIADRYYGDQYMSWLLYLSNKVVDPYYDWYMDQATFEAFLVRKYGSLASPMSKVMYYRNNWYADAEPTITAAQYNLLQPGLTRFYEPVPLNGVVTANPTYYSRRQEDWKIKTNGVVSYAVANGAGFAYDEIVDVKFDADHVGRAQVAYANSSVVTVQHLSGTAYGGTIVANSSITGRESGSNTHFTAATLMADNVPAGETQYWSPVTYYDYENEINERNKSILVFKSEFASKAAKQLKDIMKK